MTNEKEVLEVLSQFGEAANDQLTVVGDLGLLAQAAQTDRFVHTPGASPDAGRIDDINLTLGVTLLGINYQNLGLGGAVHDLEAFTPHVTLLRDAKSAKAQKIDPIKWRVQDFVLIQSLLGKTTHIHLGRWPLKGQ